MRLLSNASLKIKAPRHGALSKHSSSLGYLSVRCRPLLGREVDTTITGSLVYIHSRPIITIVRMRVKK